MGILFRIIGWLGIVAAALVALAAGAVGFEAWRYEQAANATVPAGYRRDASYYVTSKDGTRIAIEVWLPENLAKGQRVPALIKATPYWRAWQLTWLGEAFAQVRAPDVGNDPDNAILNARGYAVVIADARGTGASFGTIKILFSDAEIADYGSVADWITAQPWSNGKVGAYGFSYRGVSAANIASLDNPAIKAVAPLFDLSDLYLTMRPGGALDEYLVDAWSTQTRGLNNGEPVFCAGSEICKWLLKGPKPVDGHADLLAQAIAQHEGNFDVAACVSQAVARDDKICHSGLSLTDVSLIARKAKVQARGLPMFAIAGWLDESSPAQVLNRFQTFSNPQQVVIGPFTHGGFMNDDPFLPARKLDLDYTKQTGMMADFFDRYLKDGGTPIVPNVHYYVNGAAVWRDTPQWPPASSRIRKVYLTSDHTLVSKVPKDGVSLYLVDFTATTGALSGYRGQVDVSKTDYGNRAAEDKKLMVFDGDPVAADTEIAGDPVAHLKLASGVSDPMAIVYLEDVGPDGRVTYITQGVLKLQHRKPAKPGALSADPLHTYLRADMNMARMSWEDVAIALSPIAAVVKKGHALRIAIAGADAGNLERSPDRGTAALTVEYGPTTYVELPVREEPAAK
ncbi:MAG TPA: CocE/NonD family hydrolase [Rhizomicrobium sp.]|nr:CocE/NonD family hydrolase [Rhizomicrobium sp.]